MPQHRNQPFFSPANSNNGAINQFGNLNNTSNTPNFNFNTNNGGGPSSFFGEQINNGNGNGGSFNFGQGVDLLKGLTDAYLGFQNLKLGRDQFDFTKNSFNSNLANQAQSFNNQLEAVQGSRLASSGRFDRETDAGRADLQKELESFLSTRRANGAPI